MEFLHKFTKKTSFEAEMRYFAGQSKDEELFAATPAFDCPWNYNVSIGYPCAG